MNADIYNIIGVSGTVLTVIAYFLSSFGIIKTGITYQLLNAFGSTGLIISLTVHHNIAAMILETTWLVISIGAFVNILYKKYKCS